MLSCVMNASNHMLLRKQVIDEDLHMTNASSDRAAYVCEMLLSSSKALPVMRQRCNMQYGCTLD